MAPRPGLAAPCRALDSKAGAAWRVSLMQPLSGSLQRKRAAHVDAKAGSRSPGSGVPAMTAELWDGHSSNKSMASTLAVSRTNLQLAC